MHAENCGRSGPEIRMLHHINRALVHRLIEILRGRGQFDQIIELCRDALEIDQMDESINRELIFALAESGRNQEAIQHYNQITELYYNQLGVQPSEELRGLYHRIAAVERKAGANTDSDLRRSARERYPAGCICMPVRNFQGYLPFGSAQPGTLRRQSVHRSADRHQHPRLPAGKPRAG